MRPLSANVFGFLFLVIVTLATAKLLASRQWAFAQARASGVARRPVLAAGPV
jgi:hypothetical protein